MHDLDTVGSAGYRLTAMRKRYIGIPGGGWAEMGEPEVSQGVMVMGDIAPYRSMVDGSEIGGRAQHRAHLREHRLIEIGNEVQSPKPKALAPGLKQQIIEIAAEKLRYR